MSLLTSDEIRKVRRLEDLRVDGRDPIVAFIGEWMEATSVDGELRREAWAELVPLSLELGWWELWLRLMAPHYVGAPFGRHHREFWQWWMNIGEGRPRPYVGCWARGAAKSTTVQLALLMAACTGLRDYCLYIGATQYSVEDKVSAVGELLTGSDVGLVYPDAAEVYETALGKKKDFRKARIRTVSGFTLDALGMDQAIRGIKLDEARPGLLVLDDLEATSDTDYIRGKKITTIRNDVLGTIDENTIVVYIQNLIHEDSIMAQVIDGRVDFIADRIVSGPVPQVEGLIYEENPQFDPAVESGPASRKYLIVGGEATWEGLDLEESEEQLNTLGPVGFLREKQHETDVAEGDRFPREMWRYADSPPISELKLCRSWDLAASTSSQADYTVGALMGVAKGQVWIIDVARGRWGAEEVESKVRDLTEQDRADYGRCPALIETQPGAAGKVWAERWKREILMGLECHMIAPQGSKDFRADGWSAIQRSGMAYLVKAPWNSSWVAEHALFPDFGRHDDQVDTGSQGTNWLTGRVRRSRSNLAAATGRQIGHRSARPERAPGPRPPRVPRSP